MNFLNNIWSLLSNSGLNANISSANARRIRLSNQLIFISIVFTVTYALVYSLNGFYKAVAIELIALVFYSLLLFLARSGHPNVAKFLFILILNIHLYFLCLCFGEQSQIHLLFIPISAVPLVLFDFRATKTIISFILFSIFIFLLLFIFDLSAPFAESLSPDVLYRIRIGFNVTAIVCELIIIYSFISNYDRAERSLDEDKLLLEYQLAVLFDNSFDAIFLVDAKERKIIKANMRAAELFEMEKESEFYGQRGIDFHKEKLSEEDLRKMHLELLTTGKYEAEVRYKTKKDNEFWGALAVRKININGKPYQSVRVTDITSQKKVEQQIQSSLKEKEILLAEIHHRVKNNLAVVSGLLGMQASYLEDENAKRLFEESRNRIRSMALIHDKLYQHETMAKINFCAYINDLVDHIKESYISGNSEITFSVVCNNIFLDIKNAVPCGLILNELISNSCKHAFREKKEGEINIVCTKMGDKFTMAVRDNGIGFDVNEGLKKSHSLGLTLISALSEQVGGQVKTSFDNGTEYYISFEV